MLEDSFVNTPYADRVRAALARWNGQHDYIGESWEGVEVFHQAVASVASSAAVQAPKAWPPGKPTPWYKYGGSLREDMDGKDWRLVLLDPDGNSPVVVNCHSLLHDDVWTLTTTVFSTGELDTSELLFIGDTDMERRVVKWTLAVVDVLGVQGYTYSEVKAQLRARLVADRWLNA